MTDREQIAAAWARRDPASYGTATSDPLGRDGDGWHINDKTKLPTRDSKRKRKIEADPDPQWLGMA